MKKSALFGIGILGATALCGMTAAHAAEPYFHGRTITILVGYSAGGGADLSARTFSRYLAKHVAGEPTVIVKNMPGASSTVATNYLNEVAKPDGETLMYGPWFPQAQILSMPGVRFRYQDLSLVGMMSVTGYIVYARTDVVPGGLKSAADLKKATDLRFAGGSAFSNFDLYGEITLDLFGVKHRHITGYRGSAKYRAALLKGEGNVAVDTTDIYRSVLDKTMLKPGIAKVLWSVPERTADGKWTRNSTLKDVPTVLEVYRKTTGKDASGLYLKALELMAGLRGATHVVIAPPKLPAPVLAALRKGFDGVLADAGYRAEYNKRFGSAPDEVNQGDAEAAIKKLVNLDPEQVGALKQVADSINNQNRKK